MNVFIIVVLALLIAAVRETDQKKSVSALILARGGSKGIPLKNIVKIGDDTLLGKSLKVLKNVEDFDAIWVSTDHAGIEQEAKKCKIHV